MLPEGKIKKAKTPEQALAALMRLCARAEKSSGDALRLMRTWGVPESARAGVLKKLTEQRFIDNKRYTGAFVREKIRLNGWGAFKIKAALHRKGIATPLIDAALAEADPEGAAERLFAQLKRKITTVKYTTPYEQKTKLIRYGLSLGYDYSTVLETVTQIVKTPDEPCEEFF